MRNPYDAIGRIGLLLAIVGAVNWLLVGIFQWNLVKWIFTQSGTQDVANVGERIVYIVVGAGGILAIPMLAASLSRARAGRTRAGEETESHIVLVEDQDADQAAVYRVAPVRAHAEPERTLRAVPVASGPAEDAAPSADERLRYGPVEEADDEYGQERRAA